jgi:light-regulated signal transduction histidine kinase (bacteriophytochrome)
MAEQKFDFPDDLTVLNQGQFLRVFHQIVDEIDKAAAVVKQFNGMKTQCQQEAIRRCNEDDIQKLSGEGITVTTKRQPVIKVSDEAQWSDVLTRLIDDGYAHMVQRRLSAAKLQEEVDTGYRLPDGLSLEEIQVATHRRSN